ncbi:MAG: hypothetical protein NVS3B23_02350 [Candidatus Saccharimonadales bacterium]
MNILIKSKVAIMLFLVTLLIVVNILPKNSVYADAATDANRAAVCEGLNATSGAGCDTTGSTSITDITRIIINVLSIVVGFAGLIMIIIGSIKYITSGGDSSKIASAKNTILYAIIGLVIAALAQTIVRFVLIKAAQPNAPSTPSTSVKATP